MAHPVGGQKSSPPRAWTSPVHPLMPGSSTVRNPGAVNPGSATPVSPRDKMGEGGATKELSSASSTHHSSFQHLSVSSAHSPEAGLRAGPESLRGRAGTPTSPDQVLPHHEQRNAASPGEPTHRAGEEPPPARDVTVRRGLGAAGASEPVFGGRAPAASAVPPDRHRTLPPPPPTAASASASQPELHLASRAPTLRLGRSAGPSSPGPPQAQPPPQRRPKQIPCFCFEFSTPPRGRARDSPRRDPRLPQKTLKKSPTPYYCPQRDLCPLQLDFALPSHPSFAVSGRRVESGRWLSATDPEMGNKGSDRFERRKEIVSGRVAPFKGPHLFCFRCFEKSAQSSRLCDWMLVQRSEC